jgi:hypothetical protein
LSYKKYGVVEDGLISSFWSLNLAVTSLSPTQLISEKTGAKGTKRGGEHTTEAIHCSTSFFHEKFHSPSETNLWKYQPFH